MKFKQETLGIRVLIKPLVEKMSAGGIAIVRDERTQAINTDKGEIMMIGDGAWFDQPVKPDFKVGDKVMYAKWGAKTIQDLADKETFYILCNDEDLLVGYSDE